MTQQQFYCLIEHKPTMFVSSEDNPDMVICTSCRFRTSRPEKIKTAQEMYKELGI